LASWPAPLSQEEVTVRIVKAQAALADEEAIKLIIEMKAEHEYNSDRRP